MDNLSSLLSFPSQKQKYLSLLLTQYVSVLYKNYQRIDHCKDVHEYDYTREEKSEYIEGMIENLHYKNAFELLDEYDDAFIDTVFENKTIFY